MGTVLSTFDVGSSRAPEQRTTLAAIYTYVTASQRPFLQIFPCYGGWTCSAFLPSHGALGPPRLTLASEPPGDPGACSPRGVAGSVARGDVELDVSEFTPSSKAPKCMSHLGASHLYGSTERVHNRGVHTVRRP